MLSSRKHWGIYFLKLLRRFGMSMRIFSNCCRCNSRKHSDRLHLDVAWQLLCSWLPEPAESGEKNLRCNCVEWELKSGIVSEDKELCGEEEWGETIGEQKGNWKRAVEKDIVEENRE